jgi:AcrR family transcriptional regulator
MIDDTKQPHPGRRAVRDEQKQARRDAILATASHLFDTTEYFDLTMAAVAAELGLAKGTLYLYFESKEELFLALTEAQLRAWLATTSAQLAALGPSTTHTVAATLAQSLIERPQLTRLLALLHGVLEHNVSLATTLAFKRMLLDGLTMLGAQIEGCLPALPVGSGSRVLLRIHACLIGLRQLSDPAPIARSAIEADQMATFRIDFATELQATIEALLRGMRDPGDRRHETGDRR